MDYTFQFLRTPPATRDIMVDRLSNSYNNINSLNMRVLGHMLQGIESLLLTSPDRVATLQSVALKIQHHSNIICQLYDHLGNKFLAQLNRGEHQIEMGQEIQLSPPMPPESWLALYQQHFPEPVEAIRSTQVMLFHHQKCTLRPTMEYVDGSFNHIVVKDLAAAQLRLYGHMNTYIKGIILGMDNLRVAEMSRLVSAVQVEAAHQQWANQPGPGAAVEFVVPPQEQGFLAQIQAQAPQFGSYKSRPRGQVKVYDIVDFRVGNHWTRGLVLGFKYKNQIYTDKAVMEQELGDKWTGNVTYGIYCLNNIPSQRDPRKMEHKKGAITFTTDLAGYYSPEELGKQYYKELSVAGIQVQIRTIHRSIALLGLNKIRTQLQQQYVGWQDFNFRTLDKRIEGVQTTLCCAGFTHPNGTIYNILLEDCEIKYPSLKGYNLPKDRTIRKGSTVYVRDKAVPSDKKYIVQSTKRYQNSCRLKGSPDLQKLDVVVLSDKVNTLKTFAKNLILCQ